MNHCMTDVLASPIAARDHAQRMADTVVEPMLFLPPAATHLSVDVSGDLLREGMIAARRYASRHPVAAGGPRATQ